MSDTAQAKTPFKVTRGADQTTEDIENKETDERPKRKGTLPYKIIWSLISILVILSVLGVVYYIYSYIKQ